MYLKAILVWLLIALAETLHGMLRIRFLNRPLGDRRARQVAVVSGSLLILTIGWLTVPWLGLRSVADSLGVGALWLGLMLAFDVLFGRLVFRASWSRIAADFDPRRGGFLGFGMTVLFFTPWLIARSRGLF